jgi:hypothetical protein
MALSDRFPLSGRSREASFALLGLLAVIGLAIVFAVLGIFMGGHTFYNLDAL